MARNEMPTENEKKADESVKLLSSKENTMISFHQSGKAKFFLLNLFVQRM